MTSAIPEYDLTRAPGCPFDPSPTLRARHAEGPVTRTRLWDGSTPWLVTGHAEHRALLADPRVSVDQSRPGMPRVTQGTTPTEAEMAQLQQILKDRPAPGLSFIMMDEPEHTRLRRMVTATFTAKRMEAMRPAVHKIVDEFIDTMLAGPNPADLVEAFALPVPSLVISELLGVPYSEHDLFQRNSKVIISRASTALQRLQAHLELGEHLDSLLEEKLTNPGDDLLPPWPNESNPATCNARKTPVSCHSVRPRQQGGPVGAEQIHGTQLVRGSPATGTTGCRHPMPPRRLATDMGRLPTAQTGHPSCDAAIRVSISSQLVISTGQPRSALDPNPPQAPRCTMTNTVNAAALTCAVSPRRAGVRRGRQPVRNHGLRFAFYGRMSTVEFQDRETSFGWQREVAEETIRGHGVIVAEFFDEGCSRRLPWRQRPAAAQLMAAAEQPNRSFDAVVIGEYERAFYGDQFNAVLATLRENGIQLWLPEADGPVNRDDPVHQALMLLLGSQSRREVLRARHRVLAAMHVQARVQGRFLGGQPPYGYRLADAGPHPNRAHASWGRRLHRLELDPAIAPWVRWIFQQRATGRSVAGIARELNDRGVPCPSSADRVRNRHRTKHEWIVRTVVGILENPRYTGRQVWNRHGARTPGPAQQGASVRPSAARGWAESKKMAHPALVDEATFVAIQGMRTARLTQDGDTRKYILTGLVQCQLCGRRLDSHWVNGRPGYRCRHGHTSACNRPPEHAKNIYVREDHLLNDLRARLAETVGDDGSAIADYLRSNDLTIMCGGPTREVQACSPQSALATRDEAVGDRLLLL
ncbi:recombinase family protein [Amycolatopsis sp. NPDC021455]|uniref:recombinase family protein n=1 Tax=Amycolatopsis sp. NPDC021455 TaxID=3154901 RepID=UPI0033FEDD82